MKNYLVAIYQNQTDESIVLNPNAKDKSGINSSTNRVLILERPFTVSQLGKLLIEAFLICEKEEVLGDDNKGNVHEILGFKSVSNLVKQYKSVSVYKLPDSGKYLISPLKRYGTKGYVAEKSDKEFSLGINASAEELSEVLLKALKLCR